MTIGSIAFMVRVEIIVRSIHYKGVILVMLMPQHVEKLPGYLILLQTKNAYDNSNFTATSTEHSENSSNNDYY